MLVAGATVFENPVVTPPTPLSIDPVPPLKAPVSVLGLPCFTAAGEAAKLVMRGAATTVTVTGALLTEAPAPFVTVNV